MGGDKWSKLKNIHTAVRSTSSNEDQDEGQARGLERRRRDPGPDNVPPHYDPRTAYSNRQRFTSDPGPHNGIDPWYNSQPPPPQGPPLSSYNQNYQGGQYQAGPQGYAAPAPTGQYQSTNWQANGLNQGYFGSQPPASYPPQTSTYQQQPMAPTGQSHQGGQSAYTYPPPQNTDQPASSSHSPPLGPRPGSQNSQNPNQSPNFPGQSYYPQSSGGSLARTVTAPASLYCEHGIYQQN